jgi:hypothetical protein
LVETALNEANAQGLFTARISAASAPAAKDLLVARNLAPFLPDAAARFAPLDPVALQLRGAESVKVVINPCGPGGIPIIEIILTGLQVGIEVGDQPYYDATLGMHLVFEAGLRAPDRQLTLGIVHLGTELQAGGFAPELVPAPVDSRFQAPPFAAFMHRVTDGLGASAGRILAVDLPGVSIGGRTLSFLGSSVRDDYVTLDARVIKAP